MFLSVKGGGPTARGPAGRAAGETLLGSLGAPSAGRRGRRAPPRPAAGRARRARRPPTICRRSKIPGPRGRCGAARARAAVEAAGSDPSTWARRPRPGPGGPAAVGVPSLGFEFQSRCRQAYSSRPRGRRGERAVSWRVTWGMGPPPPTPPPNAGQGRRTCNARVGVGNGEEQRSMAGAHIGRMYRAGGGRPARTPQGVAPGPRGGAGGSNRQWARNEPNGGGQEVQRSNAARQEQQGRQWRVRGLWRPGRRAPGGSRRRGRPGGGPGSPPPPRSRGRARVEAAPGGPQTKSSAERAGRLWKNARKPHTPGTPRRIGGRTR
jgi:hypothetical protein